MRFFILCMVLWGSLPLSGQIIPPDRTGIPDPSDPDFDPTVSRRAGPQDQREVLPDTFGIFLYEADNPNDETRFADSLLDNFHRYAPDRRVDFDYATLGQIGSAAHPLLYRPEHRVGMQVGYRQYDLYQIDADNLTYYRLERPFTYLRYLRGSDIRDGMLTARFSRNFADGVNLLFNYERIFQTGEQDQYPGANLRNTHVATGLSVRPGRRWSGYFSFAANTYEQAQNGGIADFREDVDGEVDNIQNLIPFLDETTLRQTHTQLSATQYLQFGGSVDTLSGRERRAFTVGHNLRYDWREYRLSSETMASDTAFYNRFPGLPFDPRGLRNGLVHNTLENRVTLSTFRRARSAASETVQKDLLEVGATHQLHTLQRANGDSVINNVLAHARVGLRPSDRLSVLLDGQLNLIGQVGDYRVAATGELDLGAAGKLELEALNQLYAPDLIQRNYYLNDELLYDRDFGKTLELRVGGAYTLPILKIRLGAAYHLLTDYVYFDTDGLPRQSSAVNSILQLTAERRLRLGSFVADNRVFLQEADRDVFRLPQLYGEHSFYYAGKWFGVLDVNLGIDVRYVSGYRPYYFNPVLQRFQLQEEFEQDFYVQVDPFFSMRVTRFRFFVRYIHGTTTFSNRLLNLTALHPYPDAAVRVGASWRLLD